MLAGATGAVGQVVGFLLDEARRVRLAVAAQVNCAVSFGAGHKFVIPCLDVGICEMTLLSVSQNVSSEM